MSTKATETNTKMATRDGYGKALCELGKTNDFVVLCADLSDPTRTVYFEKEFPDRFIQCGIAEANMMSIAAGIATTGKTAFASTFAMFAAGRAYEQIRNSIAYPHLNVKIGATHAGLSVGEDGATHQCIEDIALMRVIPGMTVFSPCDGPETMRATEAALSIDGPVYIRIGRSAVDTVSSPDVPFVPGKGIVMAEGKDTAIIATGLMVCEALKARELLLTRGIEAAVINIHTIKPMDDALLADVAAKYSHIFTAEEHSVIGGLGAAVLESLAEANPVKVTRIGVEDAFGRSGPANAVLAAYGLDAAHIADRIEAALK
jgi:transketolase